MTNSGHWPPAGLRPRRDAGRCGTHRGTTRAVAYLGPGGHDGFQETMRQVAASGKEAVSPLGSRSLAT